MAEDDFWIWGPTKGKPLYVSFFMYAIEKYLPKYGYPWPDIIYYFKEDIMTFISKEKELRESGLKNFKRWILDDRNIKILWKEYKKNETALKRYQIRKSISFDRWYKLYLKFWGTGLVPEISNLGGEKLLREELSKHVPGKHFNIILEKISSPTRLSFYMEEEKDLLLADDIKKHTKRYFWIKNSYYKDMVLEEKYFMKRKKSIKRSRLKELMEWRKKKISEKKEIYNKYDIPRHVQKIANRLSFSVWWQDLRKKEILRAQHYLDIILNDISKEKGVAFEDLLYYMPPEILEERRIDASKRKKYFMFRYRKGKLSYSTRKVKIDISEKDPKEIKGTVVSAGKNVKGKVRIVLSPHDRFNKGEILVTTMTTPDFFYLMKKAKAIITDYGGITSHAAIVSRELKKPCIVGTKNATKLLNEGDIIEVNTERGIVKKIK